MKKKPVKPDPLRAEAEAQLARAPATDRSTRPAEELLHELRVHQTELEMQNENLRLAQITLEVCRDRYMDLYDFAPVGYLTLTREGLIAQVNLTGAALLGVERKKLLHRRFAKFVAPENSDRWHQYFMRAAQHDNKQSCELALKRGDGSVFHARLDSLKVPQGFSHAAPRPPEGELSCGVRPAGAEGTGDSPSSCELEKSSRLHNGSGSSGPVRITFTDITERKRTEEELRIAAIAFESQQGMIVTDTKGVIVRVNQAFTRLTGFSAAEVVGQTPALLGSGRHSQMFYQRMWKTLEQKRYWQGEIWNRRKNGKIYAEWLTISAVAAPDGSVTHYVGTFSDITRDSEAEAEIHRMAYYDPLTHLPNRRLLMDRLGQALASSHRSGRYGALLFMDLDNFKMLNDTRGHDIGDLLLTEIAQRLIACVREGDTVARLGGDEFVLMLEDLSEDVQETAIQASLVGEKVRKAIALPCLLKEVEFTCTVSIGISLFCNHDASVDDLLKRADIAMYHAKKGGRNSVRFFDPDMQAALVERSALENDLRRALERRQFRLYYQIQVNSMRRAIGAEALLRWEHPERCLVSPTQFIPLAEETGLIIPIGLWVLHTACAQIRDWADHPATRDLHLAINVSARQFRQPDFVEQVQRAISATGVNPARLKIELTESLVLDNVTDTIARMHALKALGVSFSMDDFGTGYSSLSYLKQLPLDQLKIDQSFIRDLANDSNDAAIVQAIITMGRAFGLTVIAEGVETEAQHEFLELNGCHAFQGYLFSKPVPVKEFERLALQYI